MAREKNFLLGQGERLTGKVDVPSGGGKKKPPYDFDFAKKRIAKQLSTAEVELKSAPKDACPKDQVVAVVTMHPRYISKSDFPEDLLNSVGLKSIGSRSATVKPEKWGTKKHPTDAITEQVYVAGTKESFNKWSKEIDKWTEGNRNAIQIATIEDVSAFRAKDKIKQIPRGQDEAMLEVVIHNAGDKDIVPAFEAYAKKIGAMPIMDRKRDVRGLTFLPVRAEVLSVQNLAKFSFLRVVRGMPSLRPIGTNIVRSTRMLPVVLPTEAALNTDMKIAIFDGGVPTNVNLARWVNSIDAPGVGAPLSAYVEHGVGVTSAFLFGHIDNQNLPRPYCNVDHIRVLDKAISQTNDLEILDVLDRILKYLDANPKKYEFINISLGPNLPVTDDDVTNWTASLDDRLSKTNALTTVAVGNDGDLDNESGLNRVQPPADGVNVLAVGACNSRKDSWVRAPYSCVGPGRRPGIVKPDGVAFGGSDAEPFMMLAPTTTPNARADGGTSFAAPLVLRAAAGVKAHLGKNLSPRAIRALMIHQSAHNGHSKIDVGWGKFETDVERLVTCDDHEAMVVFQGELPVGDHLRVPVPLPSGKLEGMVTLSATLVIAPEIDPEHPGAYTRSGLEVAFRPHFDKFRKPKDGKTPKHPQTQSFFALTKMYGKAEYEFREDGHKWEPCLRNSKRFNSDSLKGSCFDVYYHHREGASAAKDPKPIPYAFVVSVNAPKVPDFYNRVVRHYANVLVPLKPQIQIQIKV